MKEDHSFFAMMSRLKYINRWALMRNSREENLSEHSLEVAMLAHALCTIGNKRFGKTLNADRAALIGLYHDATEIITGDMPTPVKYFNSNIKSVYKEIEHTACGKLLSILNPQMSINMRKLWLRQQTSFQPILNVWMRRRLGITSSCKLRKPHLRRLRS